MFRPAIPGIVLGPELGRGAHSVVYRGTADGVPCAVKLPRTRARWTRWIYREAVALARVKHEGLPAVLAVGEVDGLPYIAMELVGGKTLADRLASSHCEESELVTLAIQLASTLSAVHDAGLVHRDVKSRNIVIAGERVALVDFGFTTPMERTGDGETAGTAAYAAPEQLIPPGRVDARSDLYGLGRVMLEALSKDLFALPSLSSAELRAGLVERGITAGLAEVISHLLERDPSRRYADGRALSRDLDRVRRGTPPQGALAYLPERAIPTTIAREVERAQALEWLRSSANAGRVLLLQGPRGSGKTYLLHSIEAQLRQVGRFSRSACSQDDPPLSALRRILESCFVATSADGGGIATHEVSALFGNLLPVGELISPRLEAATEGVAAPEGGRRLPDATEALAEGAAELVVRIARRFGRLTVIVDDVQWMDHASVAALVRVVLRAADAPLVLVLASRTGSQRGVIERFAAARDVNVPMSVMDLAPLDEERVSQLVRAHLAATSIDAALITRVCSIADGTPLGSLEVLAAFLDAGALRPHAGAWIFDADKGDAIILPRSTLALLARRLDELPLATRRVLEAAAVCGNTFSERLVARTLELTDETVGYAMVSGLRAGVLERVHAGVWRFLHDSLRDALVADVSDAESRSLHQRVGEVLSDDDSPPFDELCRAARHFAAGDPARDPARVHRVAAAAAAAALLRYDDEAALEFHALATSAAKLGGIVVDSSLHRVAGEALLRLGAIGDSIAAFERSLVATRQPLARATLLGRIAWAHETNAEADRAWEALGRAFGEIDARLPIEDFPSAAATTVNVARLFVDRAVATGRTEAETDLLCQLHYQNVRLAFEYGKIGRAVQSTLASYTLSGGTASLATRSRAQALYGFVMCALGRRDAGMRTVKEATTLAKRSGDATAEAFSTQMEGMATSWSGHFAAASEHFRVCVDVYGPWNEVAEQSLHVLSGELMTTASGLPLESWVWIEKALARLRRARVVPRTSLCIFHRARALLASLERSADAGSWLELQLAANSVRDGGKGYHRLLSWGPRAMFYLETGDLGADFEALVAEFRAETYNPSSAHPVVGEYYVAVAHARMRQAFRAEGPARARPTRALAEAVADLRAAARLPMVEAHALLAAGTLAWLQGKSRSSGRLLAEAESLARRENCPWVLYGVARTRAHMLRAEGRSAAATDQARVAETLACEHGALARARVIREEFDLATPEAHASSGSHRSSASRTNRQLVALLDVARRPRRDLKAEQLAASIIDELLPTLGAERGAVWFQPEVPSSGTAVTRHIKSEVSVSIAPDSPLGALLRSVHKSGTPWPETIGVASDITAFEPARTLVVPLFLYEQPVGALSMERGRESAPFAPEDRQLLDLLAHQVPIALEIARLLSEREQLQTHLQQAKKMEAIGQLAGGLAHDFNNMLTTMKISLTAAQQRADKVNDAEMGIELDMIAQATSRAMQLTSQLLSFSRNTPLPVSVQDVNHLVTLMEPMLRRVANDAITVTLKLSPVVDAVEVEPGSFDQALMNLLINARDAMPTGGRFTIATRNVVLDESGAVRGNVTPGPYVEVEVSDTGQGMTADTLSRIFEPFFTTKPVGRGTGLGLATVYAFAKNCGGGIEVVSELGKGTTFRLYLKRADRVRPSRSTRRRQLPSVAPVPGAPPDTILVVDDDDLVRRSIAKILERNGYRVIAASGSAEAIDVVRAQGPRIGLVIMDVLLPGVTGPELGRRLGDLDLPAKLLFVSGFSADSAPIEDANVSADMLLQKPFTQSALLERVRKLMPS